MGSVTSGGEVAKPPLAPTPNLRHAGPSLHSKLSSRILRTVITTMTLLGWFVLSNHCALGGMAPSGPTKDEHACCHNNSTPTPAHAPSDSQQGAECCKAVHALVPDGIKAGDLKPADFVVAILVALPVEVIRPARAETIATDTGPPRARSFSELVLHRSLRSHAPPLLA
jgi:hypothetical protein